MSTTLLLKEGGVLGKAGEALTDVDFLEALPLLEVFPLLDLEDLVDDFFDLGEAEVIDQRK